MDVKIVETTGLKTALMSLFISKGNLTKELEEEILSNETLSSDDEYNRLTGILTKIGVNHITLLRFINFSFLVRGLHRGAQDDLDAHAKRFGNAIVRASTRLGGAESEFSDWYKDKVLSLDQVLKIIDLDWYLDDEITVEGKQYVRVSNGYVLKEFQENKDVLRGLYCLGFKGDSVWSIDMCEWAHVYQLRNKDTWANPELKELIELIQDELEKIYPFCTREFLLKVRN